MSRSYQDEAYWQERIRSETIELRKTQHMQGSGVSIVFVLDASESMKGEGFLEMRDAFVSIIEDFYRHPEFDHNVAVIQFGRDVKYLHYFSNNYLSLKHVLDGITCEGPSTIMEGLTLSISALDDGNRLASVGPFTNRARLVFISNGNAKNVHVNQLGEEDGYLAAISRSEQAKEHISNLAKRIGNANPIFCIPVGKEPDVCLLGAIAYGSKGGKLVQHKEAKQYARYTYNMFVAGEIMGRIPPSEYTMDDIKTAVIDRRKQHDIKEKDLEDVFEILKNRHAYDMNVYSDEESMEDNEYRERDSRLPPPGTRVRRGPNWHYNDQDSNGPGTVIGHWTRDSWVYVEWDTGMKYPYEYDTENVDLGDIVITDEPRLLQRENIGVGCLVQRGPDWQWKNQDGGPGNIGTVYRVKENVVYVRWKNGNKSNYRFGYDGKFDVVVCDPFDESIETSMPCVVFSKGKKG